MDSFERTKEAPLTMARQFISKFGYGDVTADRFDMWVIDNRLARDPGTDDPKDPMYRLFREERTRARGLLNRHGPDCDEGHRFQIKTLVSGKMYRIEPFTVSVLDNAAEFGDHVSKMVASRSKRIAAHERKLQKLMLLGDSDQSELKQAQEVLALCVDQTDRVGKDLRATVHQYNIGMDKAEQMVDKLLTKYEEE